MQHPTQTRTIRYGRIFKILEINNCEHKKCGYKKCGQGSPIGCIPKLCSDDCIHNDIYKRIKWHKKQRKIAICFRQKEIHSIINQEISEKNFLRVIKNLRSEIGRSYEHKKLRQINAGLIRIKKESSQYLRNMIDMGYREIFVTDDESRRVIIYTEFFCSYITKLKKLDQNEQKILMQKLYDHYYSAVEFASKLGINHPYRICCTKYEFLFGYVKDHFISACVDFKLKIPYEKVLNTTIDIIRELTDYNSSLVLLDSSLISFLEKNDALEKISRQFEINQSKIVLVFNTLLKKVDSWVKNVFEFKNAFKISKYEYGCQYANYHLSSNYEELMESIKFLGINPEHISNIESSKFYKPENLVSIDTEKLLNVTEYYKSIVVQYDADNGLKWRLNKRKFSIESMIKNMCENFSLNVADVIKIIIQFMTFIRERDSVWDHSVIVDKLKTQTCLIDYVNFNNEVINDKNIIKMIIMAIQKGKQNGLNYDEVLFFLINIKYT